MIRIVFGEYHDYKDTEEVDSISRAKSILREEFEKTLSSVFESCNDDGFEPELKIYCDLKMHTM